MGTSHSAAPAFSETPVKCSNDPIRRIWHKSAPEAVREAYRSGRDSEGWPAWTGHLARRERPLAMSELVPGRGSPLLWALPDGLDSRRVDRLRQIVGFGWKGRLDGASAQQRAMEWLGSAGRRALAVGHALEALAWCHALSRLAGTLSCDVWWGLLDDLMRAVAAAGQIPLSRHPLLHQLAAGELPLTLAHLFPEIGPCRKLAQAGRRALSAGLVDLLDGEGLLHARHFPVLRPLAACWTRCAAIGSQISGGCWSRAAQTQYEWLVRNLLRLTRSDGTHVFSREAAGAWCKELFATALGLGGDDDDHQIAALALPGRRGTLTRQSDRYGLPEAATHSEWAAVGAMRCGWAAAEPRLTVAYPDQSVQIELESGRRILWSGVWELEVRCDERAAPPRSAWEEVCWVSDDDVDYLELQIELGGGLRVQRHLLLAREDHFLLLADAVLGQWPASLEYRGRLPVGEGISFQPAAESQEAFLSAEKRLALVLPLALPEWRLEGRAGSLDGSDQGLELRQRARARSMFAPLFFDLRPRRMARPLTWRQLTVAERLEAQPNEVAVGYRVMVGSDQWLIYRSLGRTGNRTLLGHNLTSEMLVARFDRDGEVEPLLEVEPG